MAQTQKTGRSLSRAQRSLVCNGWTLSGLTFALLLGVALLASRQTLAQSSECIRLQQAIADASRNGQSERYQAAAQKQRGELDRTAAYARSVGCDNHKFLFFGSAPPPQCGEINAQIGRMQANLDNLQARAGGGSGGRGELMARYNSQCVNGGRQPNIFDAIFGAPPPPQNDMTIEPVSPDATPDLSGEAHAGSKAVCVRTCDGSYFPVSYSAFSVRLDGLQAMCSALCPNAEVSIYTYSPSADIDQAVSATGARYVDLPNALKYRQTFDSTCTCRQRGQSWADALANAEQMLGGQKRDIIVTPEKSAELSRPRIDPKAKPVKPVLEAPSVGADPTAPDQLEKQAGAISRETSGIGAQDANSGPLLSTGKGETREIIGPDGVKRRVRIIDPML
jgi:Protein of unknown function (DUF2865)